MKKPLSVLVLSSLLLTACGDSAEEEKTLPPASAEELYNKARDLVDEQEYTEAVTAFEEVERQHPYSELAPHSQVMAAFSYYQVRKYDEAIDILERYVRLYPGEESAPYAYYLIALSYYEQISDVGRDQKMTQLAMQALRDVIRRFPNSEYARDAKIKLDLTIDHLAGKEMEIGRYYLVRDDYVAAANRFRYVVETYETTTHAEEALHRLVEIYLRLGVIDEARRYASVLGHNYPRSIWYRDSYRLLTGEDVKTATGSQEEDSWWDNVTPW
ncbi:MAG: outer membrane protein assembly factor BamD [Alphaproteobacteria bacterium]